MPAFIQEAMGGVLVGSFSGAIALGFAHPLVMLSLASVAIYLASEPAGEVEDGLVDLVMLDLMLPYVSGYQVLIEARQNPKWRRVPIVVVTARTLEMDAVRALETGANDFVRKPFAPEELLARARRAIDLQRGAP